MLQSYKNLLDSTIQAEDGEIGHLDDFLFDDTNWLIHYLVVKTGGLLSRKRVLISPVRIAELNRQNHTLKLNLTSQQIDSSPDVDTDKPLFRQMEKKYFDFYSWPYYWDDMGDFGIENRNRLNAKNRTNNNSHLRSSKIVSSYTIEAENKHFGQVEDFLIDEHSWIIQNLVLDTKTWWPSPSVIISPQNIESVDWFSRCIKISMTKKELESRKIHNTDEYSAQL
jgi:hypothetical protein